MHRTTTIAALVATVAVSALAGCVTVHRPPAPGRPADSQTSRPAAPRPDGSAWPRVVQAPAREALELVGPSRRPGHTAPATPRRAVPAPAAPPAPHRPPSPPAAARHHHQPRPVRPRRPRADVPQVAPPAAKAPGVCALGRQYGGWRKDSPEAVICEGTYGH
ncbi:hypothetical protein J2Z21_007966 [Streptomyces griseochromogenes]|uniref:Lipoprotein n=1 Tax=Streptomyces griseochromogenes TaxID=68214 RepID=A0A1B1B4J8_9ACTN|nr:hypothetical protein [Streptomyces griseochromogenes]ANP53746.1 hypothetical protein AVL59_33080 [Streptomyces griseochromogenes]MBP2054954.1 hypothetical protein [Streptomyces griseochromogenes]